MVFFKRGGEYFKLAKIWPPSLFFPTPIGSTIYIYNKATISSASPTPRVRALPPGFFSRGFPPFYPPPFWPPTVCRRHRPPNPVGLIWIFSIIILILIKINLAGGGYSFRPLFFLNTYSPHKCGTSSLL